MGFKFLRLIALLAVFLINTVTNAQECQQNWLSTQGSKIVDVNGEEVTLAGVNWFGFETNIGHPHGVVWSRGLISGLIQIKDLGFNCIRVPWSNETMFGDKVTNIAADEYREDPYTGISPLNELESAATTPLELLDVMVEWCQENDMKLILDNHSRADDAFLVEYFWYTDDFTEEQWIADWVVMAERYKDYSAVVGMDINNEPHNNDFQGNPDNFVGSLWGTGNELDDWRLAAEKCGNAILEVNPNVLILVEGTGAIREANGDISTYWWGGNLQGAREYPVRLTDTSKLVYSPHEYGPTVHPQDWFFEADFPNNMEAIWEENFNFLNSSGTAPLLIGEFGIRDEGSLDEVWLTELVDFIKEQGLHFTYWCFNENSADTGGILTEDWYTVHQWKMDYLEPILHDPIPNCISSTNSSEIVIEEPEVPEEEPEIPEVVVEEPEVPEEEPEIPEVVVEEPEVPEEEPEIPEVVIEEPEIPEEEPEVVVETPEEEPEEPEVVIEIPEDEVEASEEEEEIITDTEGEESVVEEVFTAYPNPTTNSINFNSNLSSFEMFDLRGRYIKDFENISLQENVTTYDLTNVSSGIYMCRVVMENGDIVAIKVVKR